jgi:NTP pyrophosphatase (non-canonical NTP hydrolase)
MTEPIKRVKLRPQVDAFAQLMEMQLRANDHKGRRGWMEMNPLDLMARVEQEARELYDALRDSKCGTTEFDAVGDDGNGTPWALAIPNEAADVANMAMMIVDSARLLPKVRP